jgi:hypothetical protein
MIAETAASPPDLFLHVGDMAYENGEDSEFTDRFFSLYEPVLRHIALWTAPGNHEMRSSDSGDETGPYYEAFVLPVNGEAGGVASGTESFYSFDYANVHFISLESTEASVEPGSPMIEWLHADLDARTQEWTVVFCHHPPYTKGSHDSDDAEDSAGRLIDMREKVVPILEEAGVDLVLNGHSHDYERSYLIDGAYGFGAAPNFATPPESSGSPQASAWHSALQLDPLAQEASPSSHSSPASTTRLPHSPAVSLTISNVSTASPPIGNSRNLSTLPSTSSSAEPSSVEASYMTG